MVSGRARIAAEGVFNRLLPFQADPIRRIDQRIASDTHLTMSVVIGHHEYDVGRLTAGLPASSGLSYKMLRSKALKGQ